MQTLTPAAALLILTIIEKRSLNMSKSYLYTRTGDNGTTSLIGGKRARKDSARLEAYGTLDEFSAFLGCVLSSADCPDQQKSQLLEIQNMLFNLGCYLATEIPEGEQPAVNGLTTEDIEKVEGWIDELDAKTPQLRSFILPGGTPLSAMTHVARTVCRRAERRIITLASEVFVDPSLISYMNRLSDYLFILARYFNFISEVEELTWKK